MRYIVMVNVPKGERIRMVYHSTDETFDKVKEIQEIKRLRTRSDTMSYIVNEYYKTLSKENGSQERND